jgi:hypothetical protein
MPQIVEDRLSPLRFTSRVLLAYLTLNALLTGLGAATVGLATVNCISGCCCLITVLFTIGRDGGVRSNVFAAGALLASAVLFTAASLYQGLASPSTVASSSAWGVVLQIGGGGGIAVGSAACAVSGIFLLLNADWGQSKAPKTAPPDPPDVNLSLLRA